MIYPTSDQLAAMGATLQRDVCLWSALLAHEYRSPHIGRSHTRREPEPIAEADKAPTRKHRRAA
jgi:hypothetical protein